MAEVTASWTGKQAGIAPSRSDDAPEHEQRAPLERIESDGLIAVAEDHAVAADGSWSTEEVFGSLEQLEGDEAVLTYDQPGEYVFFCTYHGNSDGDGMAGVRVGAGERRTEHRGVVALEEPGVDVARHELGVAQRAHEQRGADEQHHRGHA